MKDGGAQRGLVSGGWEKCDRKQPGRDGGLAGGTGELPWGRRGGVWLGEASQPRSEAAGKS